MTAPLIEALIDRHGLPRLGRDEIDAFLARDGHHLLFIAGNPSKYPEALDVAVVLPELVRAFAGRFDAALVAADAEKALSDRYGIIRLPALILLRGDAYLGAMSRVRDWAEYLAEISALLEAAPRRPPMPEIAIQIEPRSQP